LLPLSLPLSRSGYHAPVTDAERLVAWFRVNARPLPWRTAARDPYRSLVSELMAQQTQIDRVVPRFEAFVRRFPDLEALATSSEEEVLAAWSGLGYYRRARQLHRLARHVVEAGGELPRTANELEKLPGVGPYTAAALASVVFGEAVPLMDGNVARVGARVLALEDDPRSRRGRSRILAWARSLMAGVPPGEVNEGLMELGARVCTPIGPDCGRCPLAPGCRARAAGRQEGLPGPRSTRSPVALEWLAAIAESPDGRWLLRRVVDGPILKGLWLPPFAERDHSLPLVDQARAMLPAAATAAAATSYPVVRHSITHRRIRVIPVRLPVAEPVAAPSGFRWADPRSSDLPTSSLLGKLVDRTRV
jgi:A/G-specific adenine glycosylase